MEASPEVHELLDQLHAGQLQLPSKEAVQAERRRRSLSLFVQHYWPVLEGKRKLEWNWHHEVICQELEKVARGEIDRLNIRLPPGGMKSTLVSVMTPAWEWLPGNWPERKGLYISCAELVAVRDSLKCRDLMGSELYERDKVLLAEMHNVPVWTFSDSQDSKELYKNSAGGFRQALTSGQKIVGARGDKIVIDDPTDVDDVIKGTPERIAERMEADWDWYLNKLCSRRNDERSDPIVNIMQRLHDRDLSARIDEYETLRKNPKYRVLTFPLEFDPERASYGDPRTEEGELLDATRWPPEVVEEKKGMRNGQYDAQYNQNPLPATGGIFKLHFFENTYAWHPGGWRANMEAGREYGGVPDGRGVVRPGLPDSFRRIIIAADTSTKVKTRNDPTVFLLVGEDYGGNYWLLDLLEGKWTPLPMCRAGYAYMMEHQPEKIIIEDASSGSTLAEYIVEENPDLKHSVELIPVSRALDAKVQRAQDAEVIMDKGRLRCPDDSCPWMRKLRDQHLRFPKGAHDDMVDATAIALIYLDKNQRHFAYRSSIAGEIVEAGETIALAIQHQGGGNHVLDYIDTSSRGEEIPVIHSGRALWAMIGNFPISER